MKSAMETPREETSISDWEWEIGEPSQRRSTWGLKE
jgi:hypothetical protein